MPIKGTGNKKLPQVPKSLRPLTFEESSTIFNIRANTVNEFKTSFPSLDRKNLNCKQGYLDTLDSLEYCMNCKVINNKIGMCQEIFFSSI